MNKKRVNLPIMFILVIIIIGLYIFPYMYLFFTAFKPTTFVLTIPPTFFPQKFSLQNFLYVFGYENILKVFANSMIIAIISTFLTLLISIPAAYAVSRYKIKFVVFFMVMILAARMIPYISIVIPLSFLIRTLKLFDTHLGVALGHMTVSLPLAIWLLASYFEDFPFELEEAARVDGCTRFGAILRVIIPISLGGIGVTSIFVFLASWNDFIYSLMLTNINAKTVTVAIAQFQTQYGTSWGAMSALSILFSLPIIIISFFFQQRLVSGLTMGALKG